MGGICIHMGEMDTREHHMRMLAQNPYPLKSSPTPPHQVVFGGNGRGMLLNDVWCLHLEQGTWEQPLTRGRVPSPREAAAGALYNDYVLVHGGFGGGAALSDLFVLHVGRWEWVEVNTQGGGGRGGPRGAQGAPQGRGRHSAWVDVSRGMLYVQGGYDVLGGEMEEEGLLACAVDVGRLGDGQYRCVCRERFVNLPPICSYAIHIPAMHSTVWSVLDMGTPHTLPTTTMQAGTGHSGTGQVVVQQGHIHVLVCHGAVGIRRQELGANQKQGNEESTMVKHWDTVFSMPLTACKVHA